MISVVILTLNGGRLFHRCIEAVASQQLEMPFEILVIDSGSTDGTAELAESYGRVIKINRENFNHGLTRNFGIREAQGEIVALLVQDALPANEFWLGRLAQNFEDPSVAGAYSRQIPHPGSNPIVSARLNRWSAGMSQREEKKLDGNVDFDSLDTLEKMRLISFDNVASMIRKSVWEKIPFPKSSFGEDTAWASAVLKSGWEIVYDPSSVVFHSHSKSLWYEFKRVYLDHQNWNKLVGLRVFPVPSEIFRAGFNGIFDRWLEVDQAELSFVENIYWKFWAIPYSFSQNIAQFMGALSNKWFNKWRCYRCVDNFLKRGV